MQCSSALSNIQMRLPFCSQKEKRDENAMLADLMSWAEMNEMGVRRGRRGGLGEKEGKRVTICRFRDR